MALCAQADMNPRQTHTDQLLDSYRASFWGPLKKKPDMNLNSATANLTILDCPAYVGNNRGITY